MRLWHYALIPYLPKSQLLAQWRELNSIFKKQDNHILINYIYEYSKKDLCVYTEMVIKEMQKRKIKIKNLENCKNYFGECYKNHNWTSFKPFKDHHNDRYLRQCFYNLQEKYDRGQKDFSKEQYEALTELYNEWLELVTI